MWLVLGLWWGNLKVGDHLEDVGVDGSEILADILKKCDGKTWTYFMWLRPGTNNGLILVIKQRDAQKLVL